MSLDPALQQRIQSILQSRRVVLFMKGSPQAPQCGFSANTSGILNDLGIDYAHVDVLADPAIREGIKQYGQWPTIPQLYIDGELLGGNDIVQQMADSGELHAALGLPAPDRTPPQLHITPAAARMLSESLQQAGPDYVVELAVDAQFRAHLQLALRNPHAIAMLIDDVPLQIDLATRPRAEGLRIDFVDDARGRGLVIENPNAPKPVGELTPAQLIERGAAEGIVLVDVRPADERAIAESPLPYRTLDDAAAVDALQSLPTSTPLAFLCRTGGRSQQAAEHFRTLGFTRVYNVAGGIHAWSMIDQSLRAY